MYNQASLILTENCNFNCSFCFEGKNHHKERNMSDETFEEIINKLKKENISRIVLFGGEPLINFTKKKQQILFENKDYFHVSIYTNGSLLTNELINYFLQFPNIKINISCHNILSIKGAEKVAKLAQPHQYALFVVCDHNNFLEKFNYIKPLIKKYNSMFSLQTLIPGFNFNFCYTSLIYEELLPYKKNLQEYSLFNNFNDENISDGADQTTEIIFTYDGKISLTASVDLTKEDITYPLDTSIDYIVKNKQNPNNVKIEHFPWQCKFCPIKNFEKTNCPYRWKECHDFTLCRRQILLYAIIKEEKQLLCDEIMAEQPFPETYDNYNQHIQNIMLNVTDQCNFRCKMCFCDWQDNYMTPEIADKAIELALKRKSPRVDKITINFFGGEPLMNFNLIKYVVEKWEKECEFSMTTNGSLLTNEILDYLKEHKVGLLLSIDGDKETQDYNRPFRNGQGSFEILKSKIPSILERYPQVTFRSTIIPQTVHYLYHNYQFAKKQGFKNYFCTPDAYSNWDEKSSLELKKQTSYIALDIIKDIYEGNEVLIPKFFMDGLVDYLRIQDNLTIPSTSPYRCGMGIYGFGVGATGIISACQEHSTITEDNEDIFIIGDIKNGISEEKHWKLIDKFHQEKAKWLLNECLDCKLREVCLNHVCPSRQGFMFKSFDKHAKADCLWTQCSFLVAQLTFQFFEQNFSPNFESFLKTVLENNKLSLNKEVKYEI